MRIIKPQQLIVLKSGYQIGQESFLGISVVAGCYLSRPDQFATEAKIWHAWSRAPHMMSVLDCAEPKPHAEYLLAGWVLRDPPATHAEVSIAVGRLRKSWHIVGDREAGRLSPEPFTRMPLDHPQGWCGENGRLNPAGKPLANIEIAGEPLTCKLGAATPVPHHFPERDIYLQPVRAEMNDAAYRDTVFPGLPENIDPRYFQMAAAEQWLNAPEWPDDVALTLTGFNNDSEVNCTLPAVRAVVLARNGDKPVEPVRLERKTLWLLPDSDLALIIFTGRLPLDDALDESVSLIMAGLDAVQAPRTAQYYAGIVTRRTATDAPPLSFLYDPELMPEGAALDVIASAEQHPDSAEAPHGPQDPAIARDFYQQIQQLIAADHARPEPLSARDFTDCHLPGTPDALSLLRQHSLLEDKTFSALTLSQLHGKTFRRCRFSQVSFLAATLQQCRFEHCSFDQCCWQGSRLEGVQFEHVTLTACDLRSAHWQQVSAQYFNAERCLLGEIRCDNCQWTHCQFVKCDLAQSRWHDNHWRGVSLDESQLPAAQLLHSTLTQCLFNQCDAAQLQMTRVTATATSLLGGNWQKSAFSECQLVSLTAALESDFTGVHFSHCWLQKMGFKGGILPEALLEHCVVEEGNFDRCRLTGSRFLRCDMAGSRWKDARLENTYWLDSSLQQGQFYRANLCAAHFRDCNLIGASLARTRCDRATQFSDCLLEGATRLPALPPDMPKKRGSV